MNCSPPARAASALARSAAATLVEDSVLAILISALGSGFGSGFSATGSGAFSTAFSGAFSGAFGAAFSTGGVFGVTLGMKPDSSSPGMRTLTGGALPLGSESKTIGSTMTAASTSAMAPTSRRRPRRFSVLTSSDSAIDIGDRQEGAEHDDLIILGGFFSCGGKRIANGWMFSCFCSNFKFHENLRQQTRIGTARPRQGRNMPFRDARRHRAQHARDVLVLEHADHGDRLRRIAAVAQVCREPRGGLRVVRHIEDHLWP